MKLVTDGKLITCIVPKGRGKLVQKGLVEMLDIHHSTLHHARGVGRFSPISSRGIGEQQEKEIVEVTVAADKADEVFEFMFGAGEMGQPHGGIIYMCEAPRTTIMELPDLAELAR
ncbi:MAG: hypothetical protein KDI36_13040 [Pseudomonadales bacterium]|nr:hypothetical protein [Pseudomonadales bacterium]